MLLKRCHPFIWHSPILNIEGSILGSKLKLQEKSMMAIIPSSYCLYPLLSIKIHTLLTVVQVIA